MPTRFSDFLPETSGSAAARPDVDVADVVDESVIVFKLSLEVLAWNTGAERLYGWARDEVIGGAIQAAVRCAPSESLLVILAKVRASGLWRGEFSRVTKSGAAVVVKAKWTLRKDPSGEPLDIVEISRDITAIRRSEEAFERLQYQYQNLFQASVASFWELEFSGVAQMLRALRDAGVTDFADHFRRHPDFVRQMIRATRILDVNERTVAMFGNRDEILTSLDPFWPDESLPVFAASVVASIERKPHFSSEAVFSSLNGQRYDTLFTVSFPPPLRAASRFLVGIIDVTQAKRDRAARERSERRYHDFFHFLPVALLQLEGRGVIEVFDEVRAQGVVDFLTHQKEHPEILDRLLDGLRIAELNQRAVETLRGKSATEFVGMSVRRYWTESPDVIRDIMTARYSGQKSHQALARMPTHDGTIIDVLFCAAFGPITGEQHVSLVGLIDVSDRVKAQEMLAKLQADMAHAARVSVLGELTASIAHEVSQPLTAIEANTEASLLWLGQTTPNLPEVRDLCNSTAIEVQRAADILHRIRAMAMRAAPIKASVDLNSMLEEAVLFLRHELTRNDVAIQLELAAALPAFHGDRVQLQQVMVNLGINAIQSMAANTDDSRVMSIRTWAAPEGGYVIEVADTGPGIEPDALERLFEGFFTTKSRGMGIGLAICRSIIESHGGQISADNRSDRRGATFTIHLPRDLY
jgi:PAS domain S-box-containing protein